MEEEDLNEQAQRVGKLYRTLMDKHRNLLANHLSDNTRLDWFGRTVVGRTDILAFLHDELCFTKHKFESVVPSASFDCQLNKEQQQESEPQSREVETRPVTPDNKIPRPWEGTNAKEGLKQLALIDSEYHDQVTKICHAPKKPRIKRFYFDRGSMNRNSEAATASSTNPNQHLEAVGVLCFVMKNLSPSCAKMLKSSTEQKNKKERKCKLQLEYRMIDSSHVQLLLIIYHDNMPCRKKLKFAHENQQLVNPS